VPERSTNISKIKTGQLLAAVMSKYNVNTKQYNRHIKQKLPKTKQKEFIQKSSTISSLQSLEFILYKQNISKIPLIYLTTKILICLNFKLKTAKVENIVGDKILALKPVRIGSVDNFEKKYRLRICLISIQLSVIC